MTDKELADLAARAFGTVQEGFSPLTDDGDALRLAVKLCLTVSADSDELCVWRYQNPDVDVCEQINNDPYAATRRAIVRAAAEIGKEMK